MDDDSDDDDLDAGDQEFRMDRDPKVRQEVAAWAGSMLLLGKFGATGDVEAALRGWDPEVRREMAAWARSVLLLARIKAKAAMVPQCHAAGAPTVAPKKPAERARRRR